MCNCENKCAICTCQKPKTEKIWVVFSYTEDPKELEIINTKLLQFVNENRGLYKYKCLFLPRKAVESKGFKTDLLDVLEQCGDNIEFVLNKYNTFEECMDNINEERKILSNQSDKILAVLPILNVSNTFKIEIPQFVDNKIIFI